MQLKAHNTTQVYELKAHGAWRRKQFANDNAQGASVKANLNEHKVQETQLTGVTTDIPLQKAKAYQRPITNSAPAASMQTEEVQGW